MSEEWRVLSPAEVVARGAQNIADAYVLEQPFAMHSRPYHVGSSAWFLSCAFWICLRVAGVCLRWHNVDSFCLARASLDPPQLFCRSAPLVGFCFTVSTSGSNPCLTVWKTVLLSSCSGTKADLSKTCFTSGTKLFSKLCAIWFISQFVSLVSKLRSFRVSGITWDTATVRGTTGCERWCEAGAALRQSVWPHSDSQIWIMVVSGGVLRSVHTLCHALQPCQGPRKHNNYINLIFEVMKLKFSKFWINA